MFKDLLRLPYIFSEEEPNKKASYGSSFFVFFKAVLRVGAQAIFPLKRLFKRKLGKIAWAHFGNNNKGEGAK